MPIFRLKFMTDYLMGVTDDLHSILGRTPPSLEHGLKEVFDIKN